MKKRLLMTAAAVVCLTESAYAQTNNTGGDDSGEEAVDLTQIDTISVTATRNPIDPFDYAGQVTVIDRD
ncbi:MAG: hypothetical protein AAFY83_14110, partial [Pseudomonadota bacterium]